MSEYIILTDSACDLPNKILEQYNIQVLPLSVLIDGKEYKNYPDEREITSSKFYELVRKKCIPVTSGVNLDAFLNKMEGILKDKKDILYIGLASTLSCTYSNAVLAMKELMRKYPERKLYAVDSMCGSLGQGLLVYLAAQEMAGGKNIEEVRDFAENLKLNIHHWFVLQDLPFARRGGRVSLTSAIIGGMLGVRPIFTFSADGKVVVTEKIKGHKAAIEALADKVGKYIVDKANKTVFISHGDCEDDVKNLVSILKKKFKIKNVLYNYMGPVMGSHGGDGVMAVFFVGSKR